MKKYILTLSLFLIAFASCKKEATFDAAAQAAKDDATIQAYLAANPSIKATKDPSGVYYQVITEGTGANPTASNLVTVNYVGKFLDGTQFDAGAGFQTYLNGNIIPGWTYGVPHVKAGGRILLIIPSGLAYGNTGSGKIAPNTVIQFTIDLLSINN